jgi:sulfur-carrier protein
VLVQVISNFIGMPTVKFTYALRRYFSTLRDTTAGGSTLKEVLNEMDTTYPGIRSYILDEQGSLRRHVNIFIDGRLIDDRTSLSDPFSAQSEIYIMQALSGG